MSRRRSRAIPGLFIPFKKKRHQPQQQQNRQQPPKMQRAKENHAVAIAVAVAILLVGLFLQPIPTLVIFFIVGGIGAVYDASKKK